MSFVDQIDLLDTGTSVTASCVIGADFSAAVISNPSRVVAQTSVRSVVALQTETVQTTVNVLTSSI